jgi:uncharacterized protein YbcI
VQTQGESEAEISKGVNQIYKGLLGRSASNICTNIVDTVVIVMLQNALTAAEIHVAKEAQGRVIIKEMCTAIIDNSAPQFINAVELATRVKVVDMHHDISIKTGKEIFVFSLEKAPTYRKVNGK